MFLWGLHNFYLECFPNDFFKDLVLKLNLVILFGIKPGNISACWQHGSVKHVFFFIRGNPILALIMQVSQRIFNLLLMAP